MCDDLNEELKRGNRLALELVDHICDMGGASECVIPVLDSGIISLTDPAQKASLRP